jgi:hypothetical protein
VFARSYRIAKVTGESTDSAILLPDDRLTTTSIMATTAAPSGPVTAPPTPRTAAAPKPLGYPVARNTGLLRSTILMSRLHQSFKRHAVTPNIVKKYDKNSGYTILSD